MKFTPRKNLPAAGELALVRKEFYRNKGRYLLALKDPIYNQTELRTVSWGNLTDIFIVLEEITIDTYYGTKGDALVLYYNGQVVMGKPMMFKKLRVRAE